MEARRTARLRRARVIAKSSVFIFDFVQIQPSGSWSGTAALKILIEDDTSLEMVSGTSSLAMKESSFATGRAKSEERSQRDKEKKGEAQAFRKIRSLTWPNEERSGSFRGVL